LDIATLREQVESIWKELQGIHESAAQDHEKYKDFPQLQEAADREWEGKKYLKIKELMKAESKLFKAERELAFQEPREPTLVEEFLRGAIERHREEASAHDLRDYDRSLYDALEGKWTFNETRDS
jgi:hypothetical protein